MEVGGFKPEPTTRCPSRSRNGIPFSSLNQPQRSNSITVLPSNIQFCLDVISTTSSGKKCLVPQVPTAIQCPLLGFPREPNPPERPLQRQEGLSTQAQSHTALKRTWLTPFFPGERGPCILATGAGCLRQVFWDHRSGRGHSRGDQGEVVAGRKGKGLCALQPTSTGLQLSFSSNWDLAFTILHISSEWRTVS